MTICPGIVVERPIVPRGTIGKRQEWRWFSLFLAVKNMVGHGDFYGATDGGLR